MTRHVADRRALPEGGRLKHFFRIGRGERLTWHRPETPAGPRRLREFLRIARGRTV